MELKTQIRWTQGYSTGKRICSRSDTDDLTTHQTARLRYKNSYQPWPGSVGRNRAEEIQRLLCT